MSEAGKENRLEGAEQLSSSAIPVVRATAPMSLRVATAALLLIFFLYTGWSWKHLVENPGALGDLIGGFFAPLAFMWLVWGHVIQGRELAYLGKALEVQIQELQLQRADLALQRQDIALIRQQSSVQNDYLQRQLNSLDAQHEAHVSARIVDWKERKAQFAVRNHGRPLQNIEVHSGRDGWHVSNPSTALVLGTESEFFFTIWAGKHVSINDGQIEFELRFASHRAGEVSCVKFLYHAVWNTVTITARE